MNTSHFSRRRFLKLTAATAATVALRPERLLAAGGYGGKKIPIGLQLYSVRKECAADLVRTITAVGKMGYKGVEFAGYYDRDAKTLRKLLDDHGLKCCGTHTRIDTLAPDKLTETIEFNKILGNKFLIVPGLPKKHTATRQAWRETADLFNELADKVKPDGMLVGYHNHSIEFKPLDGELPWDTFFGNTKKEVIMQFDTGNAMHAGGEAVTFLKKYPGRAITVHLKPFSKAKPKALIGEDELPWKDIFATCESVGNTEWYIVEYESDAFPPLVSVEKCLDTLRRWGKC
ncbi:MAG: TIM barrel protein [Verrucomicrobia bacterium]|nr:TIM barrel protein [Verrucomicrobiota bacterium]